MKCANDLGVPKRHRVDNQSLPPLLQARAIVCRLDRGRYVAGGEAPAHDSPVEASRPDFFREDVAERRTDEIFADP